MVDGHLCDGGPTGKNGWHLFDPYLADVGGGATTATIGASVETGRFYDRALYTTEVIGNWRAGLA